MMQVDGGVGVKNIREIAEAGADMFVVRPPPPLSPCLLQNMRNR